MACAVSHEVSIDLSRLIAYFIHISTQARAFGNPDSNGASQIPSVMTFSEYQLIDASTGMHDKNN